MPNSRTNLDPFVHNLRCIRNAGNVTHPILLLSALNGKLTDIVVRVRNDVCARHAKPTNRKPQFGQDTFGGVCRAVTLQNNRKTSMSSLQELMGDLWRLLLASYFLTDHNKYLIGRCHSSRLISHLSWIRQPVSRTRSKPPWVKRIDLTLDQKIM